MCIAISDTQRNRFESRGCDISTSDGMSNDGLLRSILWCWGFFFGGISFGSAVKKVHKSTENLNVKVYNKNVRETDFLLNFAMSNLKLKIIFIGLIILSKVKSQNLYND